MPNCLQSVRSHLPVHGLLFQCQGCSHGGHQSCFRAYILARPPTERRTSKLESAPLAEGPSTLPRTRSFAVSGVMTRQSTMGPSTAMASLIDIQQQLGREPYLSSSPPSASRPSPPSEESPRGESGISRSWKSTGTASGTLSEERRPVRYYTCPTGCGHYCWASNAHV